MGMKLIQLSRRDLTGLSGVESDMTILRSIEKFLNQTNMAPTRFGRDSIHDPRIVFDMRNGREPTDRTIKRLEHFMNIYRDGAIEQ